MYEQCLTLMPVGQTQLEQDQQMIDDLKILSHVVPFEIIWTIKFLNFHDQLSERTSFKIFDKCICKKSLDVFLITWHNHSWPFTWIFGLNHGKWTNIAFYEICLYWNQLIQLMYYILSWFLSDQIDRWIWFRTYWPLLGSSWPIV